MKERSIRLRAHEVRGILEGRQTQVRRALANQPLNIVPFIGVDNQPTGEFGACLFHHGVINRHIRCPYGKPGDRLWVRETFTHIRGGAMFDAAGGVLDSFDDEIIYRADRPKSPGPWTPSIHMPRWASRINLEITGVRVERLRDISEEDARAEGITPLPLQSADDPSAWWQSGPGENQARTPIESFALLWQSVNGADSWKHNPWVWVVEFKNVSGGSNT